MLENGDHNSRIPIGNAAWVDLSKRCGYFIVAEKRERVLYLARDILYFGCLEDDDVGVINLNQLLFV